MIFFSSACTVALKWIRWYFKEMCQKCLWYVMNLTRKSPETCSRMASTFLLFNFLGIPCICTASDSWNKPTFNIRHFEICKLRITLQRLLPMHTCFQLRVSDVKLLCIVKWSKISRISWICIRTKYGITPNRNVSRNVNKICYDSPPDLVLTCLARHDIFLCLFPAKLCFLLFKSDLCWVSRPHVGGVSYWNTFGVGRENNIWYIAIIKDVIQRVLISSSLSCNWITRIIEAWLHSSNVRRSRVQKDHKC